MIVPVNRTLRISPDFIATAVIVVCCFSIWSTKSQGSNP